MWLLCGWRADVCRQWADAGPCRDFVVRWYYDQELGDCLQFMYGGCEGNVNQFETKEDCLHQCPLTGQIPSLSYSNVLIR